MEQEGIVTFTLGGMVFEYDEEHSVDEERYDTNGDTSAGNIWLGSNTTIGNMNNMTEELKRELVFAEEEMKELEKARKFQGVNPSQRLTGKNLA